MTQGARLKLRRLVVVAGRVTHAGAKGNGVALKAKQVDVAAREQARVCRAVRDVACGASFGKLRGMLEDEWAGLFDMALQADGILAGGGAQLRICEAAMLVVAIGALDQLFVNPVMKGLGKIRSDFSMAPVT